MKTADLIKKREEEKDKPIQATSTTASIPPVEGMSMTEARMAGNGTSPLETATTDVQATSTTTNPVSLYEIGKQNASTNIGETEKMLKGTNVSPISTPAYEKFRNEVIGAQQFGVETEEQKKARERRDFIKQGLTGFTEGLSALANLYYTTKGAPSQTLVSQMPELSKRLYAERLERDKKLENFRAWQRSAAEKGADRAFQERMYDKKVETETKAADVKYKRDVLLAEIKNAFELGKIDKQTAAKLTLQATKAKDDKELEGIKQNNRIILKQTSTAADNKILDSVNVGGKVYTRNTRLTDNELRALAKYVEHPEEFTTVTGAAPYLGVEGKETFDWKAAAINAVDNGRVPLEVLEQMGFKENKATKKSKHLNL